MEIEHLNTEVLSVSSYRRHTKYFNVSSLILFLMFRKIYL